jgi:hypothetical protein
MNVTRSSVVTQDTGDSSMIHSVDFHAASGPGGGAAASQVDSGHDKTFKFAPGGYIMVDHARSRAERGLVGILHVAGPANPEPSTARSR